MPLHAPQHLQVARAAAVGHAKTGGDTGLNKVEAEERAHDARARAVAAAHDGQNIQRDGRANVHAHQDRRANAQNGRKDDTAENGWDVAAESLHQLLAVDTQNGRDDQKRDEDGLEAVVIVEVGDSFAVLGRQDLIKFQFGF